MGSVMVNLNKGVLSLRPLEARGSLCRESFSLNKIRRQFQVPGDPVTHFQQVCGVVQHLCIQLPRHLALLDQVLPASVGSELQNTLNFLFRASLNACQLGRLPFVEKVKNTFLVIDINGHEHNSIRLTFTLFAKGDTFKR